MTLIEQLRAVNTASAYNRAAGFELLAADDGKCELAIDAKPDLLNHAGVLHAGVMGAMIDTACGFAAASIVGAVVASHFSVNCYRPGKGQRFIARAEVTKQGKRQLFASAQLFAVEDGKDDVLIAGGDVVLLVA
ncbi:PaaI family thioesterase [Sphingomonas sp.]|uniref:PaaI family thioesterase n=1 Tax=Sphingomonas sp. TaxID=28214 RepID=UPI003CC6B3FD